jgi:hypothetical protein
MPFVSFDWNRNPSSTRCLTSGCTGPRKGSGAQPQDVRRPKVITAEKWKTFVIIGLAIAALLVAAIGVVARSWVLLLLAGIMTSPLAWYLQYDAAVSRYRLASRRSARRGRRFRRMEEVGGGLACGCLCRRVCAVDRGCRG